jgi:hypothetical protein
LSPNDIARDQDEAAVSDGELDAAAEGVDHGRPVQRLDRDLGTEGVKL